jgi:hypothetical protein
MRAARDQRARSAGADCTRAAPVRPARDAGPGAGGGRQSLAQWQTRGGSGVSDQYGVRDAACPISTGCGTRRVGLVRGEGGGRAAVAPSASSQGPSGPPRLGRRGGRRGRWRLRPRAGAARLRARRHPRARGRRHPGSPAAGRPTTARPAHRVSERGPRGPRRATRCRFSRRRGRINGAGVASTALGSHQRRWGRIHGPAAARTCHSSGMAPQSSSATSGRPSRAATCGGGAVRHLRCSRTARVMRRAGGGARGAGRSAAGMPPPPLPSY